MNSDVIKKRISDRLRQAKEKRTTITLQEEINPDFAAVLLATKENNRRISRETVHSYANDILNGHWDEMNGQAIAIDCNGVLRDGQHRMAAVIQAKVPVVMNVCYGVSPDGIYDSNRRRSASDQIQITRPDLEVVFKDGKVIALIRHMINMEKYGGVGGKPSFGDIEDYIDDHRQELIKFLEQIPRTTVKRVSTTKVLIGMYLAYLNGVDLEKIRFFYSVLLSGKGNEKTYPIIDYRNKLISSGDHAFTRDEDIAMCQYSLDRYIKGKKWVNSKVPTKLIWDYPHNNLWRKDNGR